jgi:uncharacterized membrane protein YhaH (DUF805 family)
MKDWLINTIETESRKRHALPLLASLRDGHAAFERQTVMQQASLLTVAVILLYGSSRWFVQIPIAILSLAALILPPLRTRAMLWLMIACFLLAGVAVGWTHEDNHKYLIAYWTLALACAASVPDSSRGLVLAARLLIGLTFGFAAVAKFTAPDFLSGDFFHYSLLFDHRFSDKLVALGVLDKASQQFNEVARQALVSPTSELQSIQFASNATVRHLASTLTIWTLIIEVLIAAAFLVPIRWRASRARDWLLLLFIVSAYALAPVLGFATVLATMGFVQCDPKRGGTRLAYLISFVATQLFRIPWAKLLLYQSAGP